MDPIRKDQIIRSLIIIFGGLIGIIFTLLYPFDHQDIVYNAALIVTIILFICGFALLALDIVKKLPITHAWPPPLLGFFGAMGILFFILFVLNPSPSNSLCGILCSDLAVYHLWNLILHRKQKQMESSGSSK
jgi:hypothetical protein